MGRFFALPKTQSVRTREEANAVLTEIADCRIFALDTETTGIVRSEDYAVVLSLSTGNNRIVVFAEAFAFFKEFIEDPSRVIVMWNANFDTWMLLKAGINVYKNCARTRYRVLDAMVMHALTGDADRPHGLKPATKEMLGITMVDFKTVFAAQLRKRLALRDIFTAEENADLVANYAGLDAYATMRMFVRLREILMSQLTGVPALPTLWEYFMRTEVPFTRILFQAELNGVNINIDKLLQIAPEIERRLHKIWSWFARETGNPLVNLKSTPQLIDLFFGKLRLTPAAYTATGQPQLGKKWLQKLSKEGVEHATLLLEYRDLSKKLDTYIRGIIKHRGKDGKIHTTFNQIGTRTGRLSSSGPNLQNQPPYIRYAYEASPGYKLLARDYNQLEMCVLAHLTGDPALLDAIWTNKDLHCWCASMMFGVPYDDIKGAKDRDDFVTEAKNHKQDYAPLTEYEEHCLKLRKAAKAINFGLVYGMGPAKLAGELKVDVDVAKGHINTYFSVFPKVREYFERILANSLANGGYCATILGRRRELPGLFSALNADYAAAIRKLKNTPVQGTAADITKMAMVNLYEDEVLHLCGMRILLTVHDEVIMEIPEELEFDEDVNGSIAHCMENPRFIKLDVPLRTSGKWGSNWAETK